MIDTKLLIDGALAVAMLINLLDIKKITRKIKELDDHIVGLVARAYFRIEAAFECTKCLEIILLPQNDQLLKYPKECSNYECRHGVFKYMPEKSVFINSKGKIIRPQEAGLINDE